MANKVFYITLIAGQGEIKCNNIDLTSNGDTLIAYGAEIKKEEVLIFMKKGIITECMFYDKEGEIGINNIFIPWRYIRMIDVESQKEEIIIDGSLL